MSHPSIPTGLPIGILGGSFNPAHAGHLALSRFACEALGLEAVWWLVSPHNPLKDAASLAPYEERLTAAKKIAGAEPRIVVRDDEQVWGTRYTIETVERLQAANPDRRFVYLMGEDNFTALERWQRWEALMQRIPIAVLRRDGNTNTLDASAAAKRFGASRLGWQDRQQLCYSDPPAWLVCENPPWDVSATAIRQQQKSGA